MPFVSYTLKSFEKWRSPLFGATGNFNHQILPHGILFLAFIRTNVFDVLSFNFHANLLRPLPFPLSFLKAEWKVSETGSAHWASSFTPTRFKSCFFLFLLIYSKPCLLQLPIPYSFRKLSWPPSTISCKDAVVVLVSREAMHRFLSSNNAKSNPEIKGRSSIF